MMQSDRFSIKINALDPASHEPMLLFMYVDMIIGFPVV